MQRPRLWVSSRMMSTAVYSSLLRTLVTINMDRKVRLGIETTAMLQKSAGDFYSDRSYTSVHVGGTNGKGSVSTKIASVLQGSGLKVGLFTSPHLSSFRERIKINGEPISESAVEHLLPPLLQASDRDNLNATFFELTTLLAFGYFTQEKVDVAVLEVGLGGHGDSTTVCNPSVSVLTSVALDHMNILGPTIDHILREKVGIFKPRTPAVVGPKVPLPIVRAYCEKVQAPLVLAGRNSDVPHAYAEYDAENAEIARVALEVLYKKNTLPISEQALRTAMPEGLKARPPCRFERVRVRTPSRVVEVILDVGHNPDALTRLAGMLELHEPRSRPIRVVMGLSRDRSVADCARPMMARAHTLHLGQSHSARAFSVEEMQAELAEAGLKTELSETLANTCSIVTHSEGLEAAVRAALAAAAASTRDELLVVCGSCYLMHEARRALGIEQISDPFDLSEVFQSPSALKGGISPRTGTVPARKTDP